MFWLLVFILLAGCVVQVDIGGKSTSEEIKESNDSDIGACAPVEENITEEEETGGVYACSAG